MSLLTQLTPKAGDVLVERYELKRELGRGGFGVVFRAKHLGLGSDVGLKILLPHVLTRPELVERFLHEVRVVRELRHPNTIRVIDFDRTPEGLPFLAMELVEGETLSTILEQERQLSPERTRHLAVQVLKSLGEAHARGIVHRDLKPGNIMLCDLHGEPDFVKVLDFGIAKAVGEGLGDAPVTRTDMILGTPQYMSPEQVYGLRTIDGRSDLYGLGLIMAECLLGEPVVSGPTPMAVLAAQSDGRRVTLPDALRASGLFAVVERAVSKRVGDRFESAESFRDALDALGALATVPIVVVSPRSGPASRGTAQAAMADEATFGVTAAPAQSPLALAATELSVAAQESEISTAPIPTPPHARRFALALLAVAAVAAFAFVQNQRAQNEGPPAETAPTSPPGPSAAVVVGDATRDSLTEADSASDDPIGEDVSPTATAGAKVVSGAAVVALAHERVAVAIPRLHTVHFTGTEGADVRLHDRSLGRVPFELVLPEIEAQIDVDARLRGHRDTRFVLDYSQTFAAVALERRRARNDPGSAGDDARSDDPADEHVPEFGTIPIHR